MNSHRIPLIKPRVFEIDKAMDYFKLSIEAGRFANMGPCYAKAVEMIGSYSVIVANATLGLELALRARFKPGSRILIPSFTFKATYIAVKNAGMRAVTVPANERTWALDPKDIEDSMCDGAIVVSPFGHELSFGIYDSLSTPIIYDLAGGWGHNYRGHNVAVYSFHATKNVPVGEGGAVVSNNLELMDKIRWLSNFGHTNAKISEIQCAILCSLLDSVRYHETTFYNYRSRLAGISHSSILHPRFCSLIAFAFEPSKIYELLNNDVFECRRYYAPLIEDAYDVEVWRETPRDHLTRSIVAIPRDVTSREQESVIEKIRSLFVDL